MSFKFMSLASLALILTAQVGFARGGGGHGGGHSSSSSSHYSSHGSVHSSSRGSGHSRASSKHHRAVASTTPHGSSHSKNYCPTCPRDSHGRIKRSPAAKRRFMEMTGHPHGWKGHVVDHVVPLKRGGKDDPSNMQWQTIEEGKAKDRIE